MTLTPQVFHLSSSSRETVDWQPLTYEGAPAGESLPLPIAQDDSTRTVERSSFWRHAGGSLPYVRDTSTEMAYLIAGRVRITSPDTDPVEAAAGDLIIVPQGFTGTWETVEPIVKISISVAPARTQSTTPTQ